VAEKVGNVEVDLSFSESQNNNPSEQREMTKFQYQESINEMDAPGGQPAQVIDLRINPLEDKTPTSLIERMFLFDSREVSGIGSYTINPVSKIFTQQPILQYLKTFEYARFRLRVKILVRSSFQIFGYLAVSHIYGKLLTDVEFKSADVYLLSTQDAEGLEVMVDYYNPYMWFPFRIPEIRDSYSILNIYHNTEHVQNGLANIEVAVYGQLENVETAGYRTYTPESKSMSRGKYIADAINTGYNVYMATKMLGGMGTNSNPGIGVVQDAVPDASAQKDSQRVMQSLFGDMSTAQESRSSQNIGGLKGTNDVNFYPDPRSYSLSSLACLPGVEYDQAFSVTTSGEVFTYELNSLQFNNWGTYYARFYRLVRSSVKVIFWFYSSPLVMARYKAELQYSYSPTNTPNNIEDYQVPSKVFSVRGDHVEEILLPYHTFSAMTECEPINNFTLVLRLTCIQAPNSAGPSMPGTQKVFISHSLAEDCQYASIRHPIPAEAVGLQPADENEYLPESSVRAAHLAVFPETFGTVPQNWPQHMDTQMDIKSLMCRYDDRIVSGDISITQALLTRPMYDSSFINTPAEFDQMSTFDQAVIPFYMYHGGVDFIMEVNRLAGDYSFYLPQTLRNSRSYGTTPRVASGVFYGDTAIWPVAEFGVPYISCLPYLHTNRSNGDVNATILNNVKLETTEPGLIDRVIVRASSDMKVVYPNYLPRFTLWTPLANTDI